MKKPKPRHIKKEIAKQILAIRKQMDLSPRQMRLMAALADVPKGQLEPLDFGGVSSHRVSMAEAHDELRRKQIEAMGLPGHLVSAGPTLARPNPLREYWEKHGDLHEPRIPNEEHSVMSHAPNPILSIRQKLELDRVRVTRGRDGEVAKIGIKSDGIDLSTIAALMMQPVKHEMVFENGKLHARGSMDRLFHHTLCPEIEVVSSFLFQHAGHIWKESHSNWHSPGITGVVELYIQAGRGARISQFSDIVKQTSQSGRNETMAVYLGDVEPLTPIEVEFAIMHGYMGPAEGEPEVLTPEDLEDRYQAIQEASEGKLDYLLEGTQWDPKNRK